MAEEDGKVHLISMGLIRRRHVVVYWNKRFMHSLITFQTHLVQTVTYFTKISNFISYSFLVYPRQKLDTVV